ncbi:hypothetical protein [Candidatus Poriferisocius sp.]|uniref:hypothetical protein n=1 Tax=Candidatus Poriferisocius sp. TaxID=3101276 RepID=UPI003B01251C
MAIAQLVVSSLSLLVIATALGLAFRSAGAAKHQFIQTLGRFDQMIALLEQTTLGWQDRVRVVNLDKPLAEDESPSTLENDGDADV